MLLSTYLMTYGLGLFELENFRWIDLVLSLNSDSK